MDEHDDEPGDAMRAAILMLFVSGVGAVPVARYFSSTGATSCYFDGGGFFTCTGMSGPSISGCGTGATISGNDYNSRLITGTAPGATCTVSFAHTWPGNPVCVMKDYTNGSDLAGPTSTTDFQIASTIQRSTISIQCNEHFSGLTPDYVAAVKNILKFDNTIMGYVNTYGGFTWFSQNLSGTPPTITAGNCGGSGEAIVGDDQKFTVTIGSTSSSCRVNFGASLPASSVCTVHNKSETEKPYISQGTANITIRGTLKPGDVVDVLCDPLTGVGSGASIAGYYKARKANATLANTILYVMDQSYRWFYAPTGVGTIPSVKTCGTLASITGNDGDFAFTFGTASSGICQVTMAHSWDTIPVCTMNTVTAWQNILVTSFSANTLFVSGGADGETVQVKCRPI